MAYPNQVGKFMLDTDASLVALGADVSQMQDGMERVVAYGSRTLSKSERNYCTTDRELLAFRFFLEHYQHYLLGRNFLVRTDHQPLRYMFSLKEPKDRTAMCLETVSSLSTVLARTMGMQMGCPDAQLHIIVTVLKVQT